MEIIEIAEELEELNRAGTRVPGFRRKVMVDIDRLGYVADELRNSVPDNMREADEVLRQKESIINQAYLESQRIRGAAEEEASAKAAATLQEHETRVGDSEVLRAAEQRGRAKEDEAMLKAQEIIQDAKRQAYRILSETDSVAGSLRDGADRYAREVLFNLEEQIAKSLGQVRVGLDKLGADDADDIGVVGEPDLEPVSNNNHRVHA
jgi:hypothetical protein